MYTYSLSTALTSCIIYILMLCFHFRSIQNILNFPVIFSLTLMTHRNYINFKIFGEFPPYLLLWIYNFNLLLLERIFCLNQFFNFVAVMVFWLKLWFIRGSVSYTFEKNIYAAIM